MSQISRVLSVRKEVEEIYFHPVTTRIKVPVKAHAIVLIKIKNL